MVGSRCSMKIEYTRTLIILGVIILILINFLFFWIGYQNYLYPQLSDFAILGVEDEGSFLVLNVEESHNAREYVVKIMKNKEVIYTTSSETNYIVLENFSADYNDVLEISAIAYNKNKEKKESRNTYQYLYQDASFFKERDHYVASQKDLNLSILGYDYGNDYDLELYYNKNKIYESKVSSENILVAKEAVEGYSGRITAYLKNQNNRIISMFNFYLNTPVVGKLFITSPANDFRTRWNDINVSFKGGENANHFFANLYVDHNLVTRIELENIFNSVTIPASLLQENTNYSLILEAVYEDYTEIAETANLDFSIARHETTNPVYVSHNPSFIKSGTKVALQSMTDNAIIYYTTDGSEPTTDSLIYKEPITIMENTTIKTFAYTKHRYNSPTNTYLFQIQDKDLVVYLSPSNQDGNYGVSSTGFTTEMAIMNKIADVVEKNLKANGVKVYRNYPSGDINQWTSQSNAYKADFHLAIHSNASGHHTARGIEIYVDDEVSPALSIASTIYDNLWRIYSGNDNYLNHRGVKYARGSLGEVNKNYLPCGALIEVAYHDQYDDALWIMENIDKIGQNIANSIISYYN